MAAHFPKVQSSPAAQTFPQEPQFLLSVWKSVHFPLQAFSPAGQTHLLFTQFCPSTLQALPHFPQCRGLIFRSTQSVLSLGSQSVGAFAGQTVVTLQAPFSQISLALQPSSRAVPSSTLPLQSLSLPSQVSLAPTLESLQAAHFPFSQTCEPIPQSP